MLTCLRSSFNGKQRLVIAHELGMLEFCQVLLQPPRLRYTAFMRYVPNLKLHHSGLVSFVCGATERHVG
jgi:hypothetical protein